MTTTLHSPNASTTTLQVLIIDPGVNDYQQLRNGVNAGIATHVLNAQADGIQQITRIVQQIRADYGVDVPIALHIVAHGSPGCLYLGNQPLSLDTLQNYQAQLSQWGSSASHIVLYGCQVALGDAGSEFIDQLQRLTQATVHASSRLVGSAARGGDWWLDQVVGTLAHEPLPLAFTPETLNTYASVFVVDISSVVVDPAAPQNEGATITLNATFRDTDGVDPANYTATIEWGDGTATEVTLINGGDIDENGTGIFFFNVDHIYEDNAPDGAPYTINVTVQETNSNDTDSSTATFLIQNVAPVINQANPTITVQEDAIAPGTVALTATDPGGDNDPLTWQVVQTPQNGTASVDASGVVSYTPALNFSGSETFLVQVQDDDGATDNVAVTVNVSPTNDAPNLLGNVQLPAVDEDTLNPTGTSVSSLLAPVFNDIDPTGALAGVAVIANTANSLTQGRWQYSTDGGTNWFNVGNVSNTAALVLSASTLLRFNPAANYSGTPPILRVRALDNSVTRSFTSGSTSRVAINASTNGGSTAISSTTSDISVFVNPVNDPPVISPNQDFTLEVSEAAIDGTAIAILLANDIDSTTITWSIEGGNVDLDEDGNAAFAINATTGELVVNDADDLDFEGANNVFNLLIQATDEQGASDQDTFTVTVTDANDPPVIDPDQELTFEIPEDAAVGTVVGSISATDPDPTDTLTWSIVNGNLDADEDGTPAFSIDDNGQIAIADADDLDFETTQTYTLEVEVSDGELTDQITVTIDVTNVNEPPVIPVGQILTVPENAANGTIVGIVQADDPEGDINTWAITEGNVDEDGDGITPFAIDGTGTIRVTDGDELDFESTPNYGIEVTVIDEFGGTTTELVQINLTNVNESPTIPDGQTFEVGEFAVFNTIVGTVTGSDPDAGDTLTWAIVSGNPDVDVDQIPTFGINAGTGQIFVADPDDLDFETNPEYTLVVQATDAGGLTDLATVTIEVTNENEPPEIPDGQSFSVDENTPDGTFFGIVEVLDPEENVSDWTIDNNTNPDNDGDGVAAFGIDSTTGALFVADSGDLDFEAYDQSYTLTVQASDGTSSDTANITVTINNVNEPPEIAPDQLFTVPENSPEGTVVGQISVTDPEGETSDTLLWSITEESNPDLDGDGNAAFAIDETGQIIVNDADDLDFESGSTIYDLTIQAEDSGGEIGTAVVQVEVTDVNEPPVIDPNQTLSATLPENSANGTVVGTVIAVDPDTDEVLNWSITSGNVDLDNDGTNAFIISDTGVITVADSDDLDFETNPTFNLELTVTDAEFTDTVNFTVNLTNVNEPPVVPAGQILTVPENSANGTEVGMVMVNDPEGNAVNWSITGGNPDGDGDGVRLFRINASGLITVADGDELDFEATPSYEITVSVLDGFGETGTGTVTIQVGNVNEPPSIMSGQLFTISENAILGTSIGFIAADDPENDPLTWAIVGGNPDVDEDGVSAFGLNPQTGRLFVQDGDDLDFEFAENYTIDIQVTDPAGNTATGSVNVALTDVNEPPSIEPNQVFDVDENSPINTVIGTVVAADPEGDQLEWSILSGNPDRDGDTVSAFGINAAGELFVTDPDDLNFENPPTSYTIRVQISDGEFTDTENITVNINDVNEPPVIAANQVFSPEENLPNGSVIGTVLATDPDGDPITTWSITSGNDDLDEDGVGPFAISSTGQITVADVDDLDFELQSDFTLGVTATDGSGAVGSGSVTINLVDANDAPTDLVVQPGTLRTSGVPYTLSISFDDEDPGDVHTVTVTTVNGPVVTTLAPGQTAVDVDVTFDDPGDYDVSVTVTDEEGQSISTSVQAQIGNSRFPDFNRDALPDIVWRNYANGQNSIWLLDETNARIQSATLPPISNVNWRIEGVGDFDGDGQDDLVWRNYSTGQNTIWFMDGTTRVGTANLNPIPNTSWQLQAVGNFSADSALRDDLVWRNQETGQNVIWLMDGTNRVGTITLNSVAPNRGWEIAGVGNFDDDGQLDDIVWRNYSTGQNTVWSIDPNGTTYTTQPLPPLINSNWRIEGASDFDGDGRADDLLWRNGANGLTTTWLIEDGVRIGTSSITPDIANANWSPVV